MTKIVTIFLLIFGFVQVVYPQKIDIILKTIDPLLLTDNGNKVFDLNNEICSLVEIRTKLDSLKFYSNLGVEKISKTDNGYRIWIPNEATIVKFIIPKYPLYEYKLPKSDFKYSLYSLILNAEILERVVLLDTIQSSISISSLPERAKVFINGDYIGRTPKIINEPIYDIFNYTIKKNGYSSYTSKDSIDTKTKNIYVSLVDLSSKRRVFISLNTQFDYPSETINFQDGNGDYAPMYGLTLGVLGKTGMFTTLNYQNIKDNTGLFSTRKFGIAIGLNYQLGKSIFIYGGPAYMYRDYKYAIYEPVYELTAKKISSIKVDAGFIFRIGWFTLVQVYFSKSINNSFKSYGLGIGFNFPPNSSNKINL